MNADIQGTNHKEEGDDIEGCDPIDKTDHIERIDYLKQHC